MNCAEKLLEPTIFFNLYTKSPYQNYEWDLLKLSSTCISFADSSKAVQILLIILNLYFMFFMLSSPGDIYVKNLTYTLYCGGVCGGGAQSRRCSSRIERMWDCRSWNIRSHSQRFAMMRLRSYLCAPRRI